jgi:hypothetical protein
VLEILGNLGDFVGGIAVVATLVYLSVQVRQNTVAIEASSRQQIVSGYRDANRLWLHPGAARAYSEGLRRFPDMEFEQINLFNTLFSDQALFFQGAFALHETGQLEEETYRAYLDWFASNVATPGGSAWWEQIGRPIFMARMVNAVDARLAGGSLHDLLATPSFRDPNDGGPAASLATPS